MATDNRHSNDEEYFNWLVRHIHIPPSAGRFEQVLRIMYETEFVWVVGNDENRIADGRNLRRQHHISSQMAYHDEPVVFLEVLVALSERVSFLVDEHPGDWAWRLIKNIRLGGFSDPLTEREIEKVHNILEKVIWRAYKPDGSGGFFPLSNPKDDQRHVEIWYQMAAYIEENRVSFGL